MTSGELVPCVTDGRNGAAECAIWHTPAHRSDTKIWGAERRLNHKGAAYGCLCIHHRYGGGTYFEKQSETVFSIDPACPQL